MLEMKISRSRLFFDNFLPGAVVALREGGFAQVVGTNSDSERAQTINPDTLYTVITELMEAWENAGGEIDMALHQAAQERRFAIRSPTEIYVQPYPLVLQCRHCGQIDMPQGDVRIKLLRRLTHRNDRPLVPCHHCGYPLRQLKFVQAHRCGALQPIEPPPWLRGRTLRFRDGGTFFRSDWLDANTNENLGHTLSGDCRTCRTQYGDRLDGHGRRGAAIRTGRGEIFYPRTVQFLSLKRETTDLVEQLRNNVELCRQLGLAIACSLLGLQTQDQLRSHLQRLAHHESDKEIDLKTIQQDLEKNEAALAQVRPLVEAGMLPPETAQSLEDKIEALRARLNLNAGLFVTAVEFFPDVGMQRRLATHRRAREAALFRGEFVTQTLDALIATSEPRRREDLESIRNHLHSRYSVREIAHLNEVAVVLAAVGFTRELSEPRFRPTEVPVRLNAFSDELAKELSGQIPVYAHQARTEAILVRFDPCRILAWAEANLNWVVPESVLRADPVHAQSYLLNAAPGLISAPVVISVTADPLLRDDRYEPLLGLLHTLAHVLLRAARTWSGYDESSLKEYLFPADLSFLLYVTARDDYTSGGLLSLFQYHLMRWFENAVNGALSCAFDPMCSDHQGGACHGCLQLPLNCETFNWALSRAYLFGGTVRLRDGQALTINRGFLATKIE